MVSFHLLQDFKTAMPAPLTPTRHHLRVHAGCERAAPARNPHRVHATGGARMPGSRASGWLRSHASHTLQEDYGTVERGQPPSSTLHCHLA